MTHGLAACTTATDAQKSTAWMAYFTMKYGRFLYRQEFQACKAAIVGNDAAVIANRGMVGFSVNNTLFNLAPASRITSSSPRIDIDAALRDVGTQFGANATVTAALPTLITDIQSNSEYNNVKNDLITRIDGSFPQATTRSNYENLVLATNNIIQRESGGNNALLSANTNIIFGKEIIASNTAVTKTVGFGAQSVEMHFNSMASQELYQAGIRSCNFVANKQNLFATGAPSDMIEEVECYDASGNKQAVSGLTNKLNFIFENPSIFRQDATMETRCAFFNTATSSWQALPTTDNGAGTFGCHTDHLTTFGLASFPRTTTTVNTTPMDDTHREPVLVGVLGISLAVLLVVGAVVLHFLYDERLGLQESRVLKRVNSQINDVLVVSASHDNLHIEGAFDGRTPIDPAEIKLESGTTPNASPEGKTAVGRAKTYGKVASAKEVFSGPLTALYPHLGLVRKYSFCRFWMWNVAYLTPLVGACTRRHRLIRNSCFYIIDFMRIISLFAFVMAVPYLEEAHHFSDVRVVGLILGIVLMLPSSLYERFVTQRRGKHDVSHIVEHFLPRAASSGDKREFAARDLVGVLLCIGVLVFLAYYVAIVVLFIVDCAEAADHDIDTFWDTLEWTGWGLLAGFFVCQVAILWSAAMKAGCFASSDLSGCQRTGESLFVDLRTSIIYNDYRALKARFT